MSWLDGRGTRLTSDRYNIGVYSGHPTPLSDLPLGSEWTAGGYTS